MRKIVKLGFFGLISTVLAATSEDTLQANVRKFSVAIFQSLLFYYRSGKIMSKTKRKSKMRFTFI